MLDDWPRVKAILDGALAREGEARAAYLADACGGDDLLRLRVETLIQSHETSGSFLDRPAASFLETDPAEPDLTGRTIGSYRFLQRIGAGGMGEVYLAHDDKLDRRVAVKLITSHVAADAERVRRFRQEARAASTLNHPHILVVHDFGELDGRPFIVTELVEGQTLRDRLRRGALPMREAVEIASQVLSALSAAHARGLVHRDIKPENLMLRRDGYVKVLDFGLAKLMGSDLVAAATTFATAPGQIAGTPAYMSPEQARGEPVDARTDLFSVTAVLYEMLTGRRAFAGDTHAVVFASILEGTPPAPSALTPGLPPEIDRIVLKALEKRPELRYQSAADMRADLLRVARELDVRPPARTRWRWAAAAATAILIVVIAVYAVWWRTSSSSSRAGRPMLAVLPFENLTGDAHDEYFADGLTEEMIAQLAQIEPSKLGVIARTSTMRYKHTSESAAQISRDLGAGYLLEGSVRRAADRVRVVAELVQAADQAQVWSSTYERPLSDILRIQQDIAEQLARSLSIRLLRTDAQPAAGRAVNLESYDEYLRGLHELSLGTREGGANAIRDFKEAIEKDPTSARLYGALAQAYTEVVTYYSSPTDVMPLARQAAQRALELDPNLASAHATLGGVRLEFDWDWPGAEAEYRRALAMNPNLPEAQLGYATYLATLGRFDEAISRIQQSYLLDPLAMYNRNEALWIYHFSGRTSESIEQAQRTIEIEPSAALPHAMLALDYAYTGQIAEAVRAAATVTRLDASPSALVVTASALARVGHRDEARTMLDRALALARERYVCRFLVADADLDLGEKEQALTSLEAAYRQRST